MDHCARARAHLLGEALPRTYLERPGTGSPRTRGVRGVGGGGGGGGVGYGESKDEAHIPAHLRDPMLAGLSELESEGSRLLAGVRSRAARVEADRVLKMATEDSAELNVDGVWASVDLYREAIQRAGERDLQNEILARMGIARVFHKATKDLTRARHEYNEVLRLGASLGHDVKAQAWHVEATKGALEGIDRTTTEGDIEKMVKKDVEHIQSQREMSASSFINWVLREFPPRSPTYDAAKVGTCGTSVEEQKKMLKQLQRYYHPDKTPSQGTVESRKWRKVLQAISRVLNSYRDAFA